MKDYRVKIKISSTFKMVMNSMREIAYYLKKEIEKLTNENVKSMTNNEIVNLKKRINAVIINSEAKEIKNKINELRLNLLYREPKISLV